MRTIEQIKRDIKRAEIAVFLAERKLSFLKVELEGIFDSART